jgi:predicted MFS family arabinose efflux permease
MVHSSNRQAGAARPAMVLRILVLSVGSFAVGTGTFVVTGVLSDIAEDLSVSVASAGLLVTVFAATFRVCPWIIRGSPYAASRISTRDKVLGITFRSTRSSADTRVTLTPLWHHRERNTVQHTER